ncbi:MAG: BatA domain-containing protein [Planctomycetota bacterium]|nr:BatA domain-containing protein [Planctomycetota bacterium]
MIFASPLLAWIALSTVVVPVIIHLLLRRRRTPVAWAAMELLARAIRRSARRSKIEQILLLAARCLLILVVGAAIADPHWSNDLGSIRRTPQTILIVIDQGVASQATFQGKTLLDRSKAWIAKEMESIASDDLVGVIAMAGNQPLVWPPSGDHAAVLAVIQDLTALDLAALPRSAMEWASRENISFSSTIEGAGRETVYWLASGWTEGTLLSQEDTSVAEAREAVDRAHNTKLLGPANTSGNDVWVRRVSTTRHGPLSHEGEVDLRVQAERRSDSLERLSTNVDAKAVDRTQTKTAPLVFESAQSTATANITITIPPDQEGDIGIRVRLPQDDQPADNDSFAVCGQEGVMRVLIADRQRFRRVTMEDTPPAHWVTRALDPTNDGSMQIDLVDPSTLDTGIPSDAHTICVLQPDLVSHEGWKSLASAVRLGATVIVTPAPDGGQDEWVHRFRAVFGGECVSEPIRVAEFETPTPLNSKQPNSPLLALLSTELSDLATPVEISRALSLQGSERWIPIVTKSDDTPLVVAGHPEGSSGLVVVFGVPFDTTWSSLPTKPLIVPLLQEIIRQSAADNLEAMHYTLGGSGVKQLQRSDMHSLRLLASRIDKEQSNDRLSVDRDGKLRRPVDRAGLYEALDAGGVRVGLVAINVDPRWAINTPTTQEQTLASLCGLSATDTITNLVVVHDDGSTTQVTDTSRTPGQSHNSSTTSIATLLVMVAIAFLLLEGILARVASHAGGMLLPTRLLRWFRWRPTP